MVVAVDSWGSTFFHVVHQLVLLYLFTLILISILFVLVVSSSGCIYEYLVDSLVIIVMSIDLVASRAASLLDNATQSDLLLIGVLDPFFLRYL